LPVKRHIFLVAMLPVDLEAEIVDVKLLGLLDAENA
jgi:hypothetical protein